MNTSSIRIAAAVSLGSAACGGHSERASSSEVEISSAFQANASAQLQGSADCDHTGTDQLFPEQATRKEWSKANEKEFSRLARKAAAGNISASEYRELSQLSKVRETFLSPIPFEQISHALEYRKRLEAAVSALSALTAFHAGTHPKNT